MTRPRQRVGIAAAVDDGLGCARFPDALLMRFHGENTAKLVLRIADP